MRPLPMFISAVMLHAMIFPGILAADPWKMHVIDNQSRGADGVKLADLNEDGLLDIVTGWEEGGVIRVYLQPSHEKIKKPWPAVTVGKVKSPEDAFFADVNYDGRLDVVSCCEGSEQALFVHLAPKAKIHLLKAASWQTIKIADSDQKTRWMFGFGTQLDKDEQIEIICGSKNPRGVVGWYDFPSENLAKANWHPVTEAGWIMTLAQVDVDQDGDLDLCYSDRKGPRKGCWCRLNPGDPSDPADWEEIALGGQGEEVMFLSAGDFDGDGDTDFVCAVRPETIQLYRNMGKQSGRPNVRFATSSTAFPEATGTAKAAVLSDVDRDGQLDLVVTCERAEGKHGAFWLSNWVAGNGSSNKQQPEFHEISGTERGIKYDRIEMLDLDQDGDLDLITCEERDNLGVIWYENPTVSK